MFAGEGFDFSIGEGGEVNVVGGDDAFGQEGVVLVEIVGEDQGGAAGAGGVADEDDFRSVEEIFGDGFVVLVFLGDAVTAVVGLFAVDEMVMEVEWVVGADGAVVVGDIGGDVLKDVGGVVVDDDDGAARGGGGGMLVGHLGIADEFAEVAELFDVEVVGAGLFEEGFLGSDDEGVVVVFAGLDGADLRDEVDDPGPAEVAGEFAFDEGIEQ